MSSWMEKLAGKGRRGGNGVLVQIAREVVGRRRSVQGAISEVRHPAVLDALSDDDFKILDELIDERIGSDRDFSVVLARLAHAAAHAKGFDRQTVDAALRLDALLPADDPAREREKLLRDAYRAAQRAGYLQGGRRALARLGLRPVSGGNSEHALGLFQQQLDLGPESMDTEDEVESAILLSDLLRREGDKDGARVLVERAGRSSDHLGFHQGVAESTVRLIEISRDQLDLEGLATLQERALDAAVATGDPALQSRIVVNYADTLVQLERLDEALVLLEDGLGIARQIGDLSLENHSLELLSRVEAELGTRRAAAARERDAAAQRDRYANVPGEADDAVSQGSALLSKGRLDGARQVFEQAVEKARNAGDELMEQRAYGGLGVTYSQMNMPVEALNHLMLALDLARSGNDVGHEAQWLGSIGEALWKFGQADDAVQAIRQGITAAHRVDDGDLEAGMLSLLGQIHVSTRDIANARRYYGQALDLYRELNKVEDEIATLSSLGVLAMEGGDPSDAIALYEEALQLAARADERAAAVRIYGRLARLSQQQGDEEAALEALDQAVHLAETLDNPVLLGQALQHLAVAQDAAGDPVAMDTYEQALVLSREVGDRYGEAMMLVNVGARLISTGARRNGEQILHHAIGLTDELGEAGEKVRSRAERLLGDP
ncbi:MAG: tetratricopeptide repeat protein, partial [Chloroflexota bacterium]|nr:tetratricopeptide repeat protein [Chloroflexota bacterium]